MPTALRKPLLIVVVIILAILAGMISYRIAYDITASLVG